MADSSLDDFFAKKDKSRKKPKGKATEGTAATTPAVKKEKKKDKKTNPVSSSGNKTLNNGKQDEDEWNDFEEVKAVDYSGLRIQNLQITKGDADKEVDGEEDEYDEDGEVKEKRDASGPWRKGSAPTPAAKPASAPVEKPKEEVAPTPKGPSKYVPPAQRGLANSSTSSFPMSRRKKELPNVNSEVDFPTLGGGPQDTSSAAPYLIEAHPSHRGAANLTLENKFSALQD